MPRRGKPGSHSRSPRKTAAQLKGQPLTPREAEVAELIANGLSNKLIAAQLNISEHTAKFHVEHVTYKLGAENRTQAAVRFVMRNCMCHFNQKKAHGTTKAASNEPRAEGSN